MKSQNDFNFHREGESAEANAEIAWMLEGSDEDWTANRQISSWPAIVNILETNGEMEILTKEAEHVKKNQAYILKLKNKITKIRKKTRMSTLAILIGHSSESLSQYNKTR